MNLKTIAITGNTGSGKKDFAKKLYNYLNAEQLLMPKIHFVKTFVDEIYLGINDRPVYSDARKKILSIFGEDLKIPKEDFSEEILSRRDRIYCLGRNLDHFSIDKKLLKDRLFSNPEKFSLIKNILVPSINQRYDDVRSNDKYFGNNVQILHVNFLEYSDISKHCDYIFLLNNTDYNSSKLKKRGYSDESINTLLEVQPSFKSRKNTIEGIIENAPSKLIEVSSYDHDFFTDFTESLLKKQY